MLKLQNIHIQLSTRLFNNSTKKHLRVSVGNIVRTTLSSKFISQQSLEWADSLQFPLLYNKDFMFEIYDVHEFGYNPGEMQTIMKGKILIDNVSDSRGTWQIFDNQDKKIGFLSAEIISKVPAMVKSLLSNSKVKNFNPEEQISFQQSSDRLFRINSMVSRTPTLVLRRAYIIVEVGGQTIKTNQLKSRAGELVYIQPKQIPLETNDTDARIKIVSILRDDEQEIVAEGTLQLIGTKPSKKVILMKDGQQVGEIYLESIIADRTKASSNMSSVKVNNQYFVATNQLQQSQIHDLSKSISPSKSIDYSRLQHFGIHENSFRSPNLIDSSILSASGIRRRNSVLNKNNNVVFPKEQRFRIYQDRQNERITYLKDRSFEFKTSSGGSGKYYRGASIGYGGKTDFARDKKHNPGVGIYKLPSIWDRY